MVKNTRRKHQTTYHKCPHLLGRGSTSDAEDAEAFVLECPATVTPPRHRHDTTQHDGSKETTLTQGPNREPGEGMGTNNLLHLELKKKSSQCLSESSHHRAQVIDPLARSPKCLQQLGLGQAEIRSLTLHLGLTGGRNPATWAICCCLPMPISRKLDWKQKSQDLNQRSNMAYRHPKQLPNWATRF